MQCGVVGLRRILLPLLAACDLSFSATVCAAVLLAVLCELQHQTESEEEEEEHLVTLVAQCLCLTLRLLWGGQLANVFLAALRHTPRLKRQRHN